MKKDGVSITIGITCFNANHTIERAVRSALNQTWKNIEIIIVDDASTDSSNLILKKMQIQHPNLKIVTHEVNRGYPEALNTIIRVAAGDYIAFFDDDDESEPDRVEKQISRLSVYEIEHPNKPVLCYSHRRVFIEGEEKASGFVTAIGFQPDEPNGIPVANFLLWHEQKPGLCWGEFGSCTMLSKKSTLRTYMFDPNFKRCAEWDLAIRVAFDGGYFIAVNEALVIQHKTLSVDKSGNKPLIYGLLLRKKHKKYLQSEGMYKASTMLAYTRYFHFRGEKRLSQLSFILANVCAPRRLLAPYIKKRFNF